MHFNKKHALFFVLLAVLAVGFLELALQLLAPALATDPTVPDERFGHRPNPAYPGHDRLGFRNPAVPARVDVVALGDSQTYGVGVEADDAWPRQLASISARSVYSMAYGGYGPAHSVILWDEAVGLKPQIIIEAFYAGNDLFDAFDLVYNRKQLPELKSSDAAVREGIRLSEQSEPIKQRVRRMYLLGTTPAAAGATAPADPRGFLARHSKIYGALGVARHELMRPAKSGRDVQVEDWQAAKAFAHAHPSFCEIFESERFRTVFTSEYRLTAVDLGDARIAEGLQISLNAMRSMHRNAAAGNARFLVLLIPTKESVFRGLWQDPSKLYRELTENEAKVWKSAQDFFRENGIEFMDALPALQAQLAAGIQPYPVSQDGHPNRNGHRAIAELVAKRLASPPAPTPPGKQAN